MFPICRVILKLHTWQKANFDICIIWDQNGREVDRRSHSGSEPSFLQESQKPSCISTQFMCTWNWPGLYPFYPVWPLLHCLTSLEKRLQHHHHKAKAIKSLNIEKVSQDSDNRSTCALQHGALGSEAKCHGGNIIPMQHIKTTQPLMWTSATWELKLVCMKHEFMSGSDVHMQTHAQYFSQCSPQLPATLKIFNN